ncbi:MAG: glycosyltransferase [Azospirillaceae bacterium]|nr:glycosyltransferase [Azospirillaceae bacterium]
MREVVIFRNNLFRISETFITEQAQRLRRHTPLYLGRLRYGPAPEGADSLALRDLWPHWPWPPIGWQLLSRDPAPYLRLLRGRHPALMHAHFGIDGVYALPVARALGVPLVTTFHGFDATLSTAALMRSPAWMNYPLFRGRLARQGALFLCVSNFIRDQVLAMGFPAERTRVHYIGVDSRAVRVRPVGEETPTILHVARQVEGKGAEYLIRAFARIADRHPTVQLHLIGDGPLRTALQALAGSLGLAERIRFLGALPHGEVLAHMRRAAMLVLPSVRAANGWVEGLGMVMLEAAATGVPVIASRIGGIPEVIVEGQTGLLAPERAPEALARCMATLLDDGDLRHRMGAQARAHIDAHFDIHRQTALLEDLYDEALGHAR